MQINQISMISLFFIFTYFIGCVDDDPSPNDLDGVFTQPLGDKAMSCDINGQGTTFPALFIAGASSTSSGFLSKGVTGILVSGNDTTHVIISITYPDESAFVVDAEFNHANGLLADFAFGYYGFNANTPTGIDSYSTESGTASVIITGIDPIEQTWSANFEFTAPDDNSGDMQVISNGSFTNVEY